ncbi:adhesion G-protein coupled receptor G6-like [Saccostrea cucullata]|uniref:adhesion G-protein coupled receptor G6-like n=1 Tax=Saccostrea cuccullata TaxID=36930 RepID=UPI002ED37131
MFLQINIRGIQTCPAKCFLSFSLSWFIAQFSFTLPPFLPSRVCLTFAMLLHYLWLCIFSWSSILSFDLVKSLNACSKTLKREFKNNSLFVKYCIVGWGLPLLIVGLSNVLEISLSTFTLQYGARNICWIGNSDALLLAYILPASTFLFFNMICLAVSLHGLEIAKRNSRNLQKTRKDRQRWLMYLQMFFLCGGCWIFAYVANNVSLLWMHTLNLILNGSQGVFILIMTTRDSKVKRWIRIKMKCLEPDNSNTSQSNSGGGTISTKL